MKSELDVELDVRMRMGTEIRSNRAAIEYIRRNHPDTELVFDDATDVSAEKGGEVIMSKRPIGSDGRSPIPHIVIDFEDAGFVCDKNSKRCTSAPEDKKLYLGWDVVLRILHALAVQCGSNFK